MRFWILTIVVLGNADFRPIAAADDLDYARDIRPILAKNCLRCHGPDEQAREARLRLDVRLIATKPAESGEIAIVPGQPDKSQLLKRIHATDADEVMPPPATKKTLSAEQKSLLGRWIAAGAEYKQHWSFIPPKKIEPPTVKQADWTRNPIDPFILARLEQVGLKPSPPADRHGLVRRVYLDLIGLPPTPDEVAAFVTDRSPTAYEKLVDQLLASKHYGERWARRWLDLARYADTNGYEKDRNRSIWPYRDWVIKALNTDLPFDQFSIEQLAGDLLPNASLEQRIATGFHRNTMLNEEGGIDPLEYRWYATNDRVQTTGTTWLGLTLQCCQCHTHKYDPIPQHEYYAFLAFLNNADEPDLDLPPADLEAQRQKNLAEAKQLLADLPNQWPLDEKTDEKRPVAERRKALVDAKFTEWLERERQRSVAWQPLRPTTAKSNSPLLTVEPDDSVFASGDITKDDTYKLTFAVPLKGITAIRLEALPDPRLPAHGPGMAYYEGPLGDFFLGEFQLAADGEKVKIADASHSFAANKFGSNPGSARLAFDGDPQTGWTCAGRSGEPHEAVFLPAVPITAQQIELTLRFGRHFACSLGRFRISVTTDQNAVVARDLPEEIRKLLLKPADQCNDSEREQLREQFLLSAPELAKATARIKQLRKPVASPTTLVLRERPKENPRTTFVHKRGEYLQPTDPVKPGTFSALPNFGGSAPQDRLGLARWLVARENPLTARVTVNRQWQAFFGRGLVRTLDDLGVQGEPPTHPELLDWLAVDFMEGGWSLKKLHRRIVLSATYQQAGRVSIKSAAADPENRWLSHFPQVRLEAELIRDTALRAGGLLSSKMYGPGVHPPQPGGVTEVAYGSPSWQASSGEDRYRRSVYTFIKRTAPFAMFNTFDAPSGESCVARRDRSNTALQALTLLNDVMFVEVAQALGKSLAASPGDTEAKVRLAYLRCLSRPPSEQEAATVAKFFAAQLARCESKELDAAVIAGDNGQPVNERAAWTTVARALLNLDEFVTKP